MSETGVTRNSRLIDARRRVGYTQEKLSELAEVDQRTVQRAETGERIRYATQDKIAVALGKSRVELFPQAPSEPEQESLAYQKVRSGKALWDALRSGTLTEGEWVDFDEGVELTKAIKVRYGLESEIATLEEVLTGDLMAYMVDACLAISRSEINFKSVVASPLGREWTVGNKIHDATQLQRLLHHLEGEGIGLYIAKRSLGTDAAHWGRPHRSSYELLAFISKDEKDVLQRYVKRRSAAIESIRPFNEEDIPF